MNDTMPASPRMRAHHAFAAPDFSGLGRARASHSGPTVLFECSSYHPDADGRLVVTAATLRLGDPGALDEIGTDSVTSWSIADDGALFELSVNADGRLRTTLVTTLRASAVSVMTRFYGPERA